MISCIAMQPQLNECGKLMSVADSAGPAKAEAKGEIPHFPAHGISWGRRGSDFITKVFRFISPFLEGVVAGISRLYCRAQGLSCVKKSPANAPTLAIIS